MTVTDWCDANNIGNKFYYYWLCKIKQEANIVYSDSTAPYARSFRTTLTEDENHLHEKCTAA